MIDSPVVGVDDAWVIHQGPTAVHRRARDADGRQAVLALTIAAHPDPDRVGDRLLLDGLDRGAAVALSRQAPDFVAPDTGRAAPLGDPFVSRSPLHVSGDAGRLTLVSEGKATAIAVSGRAGREVVLGPIAVGRGVPVVLAERVVLVVHLTELTARAAAPAVGMIGHGDGVARVRRAVAQIADLAAPVLIRGETGTGKELVARALHAGGPRRDGPFVSVNLAAIPRELAAAELFGAVRGAYTGATRDREGFFRAAAGGTLFLDEVGEAPPEVQAMLLRVLETGELFAVGGQEPIATDVRLIAATDADLAAAIAAGRFKAPLLHRLGGHEIHVPPLRERLEDLGVLLRHFVREELTATHELHRLAAAGIDDEPWLPAAIADRLLRFGWPGNIRQLRNVTRHLVIAGRGRGPLELDPRLAAELDEGAVALPVSIGAPAAGPAARAAPAPAASTSTTPGLRRRPSEISEVELRAALQAAAWDLKAAADALGIPRPSMYDVIARHPSIRTAGDLTPTEIEVCHQACAGDLDRMAAALEVSRRALGRRVKELGLDGKRPGA